MLRHGMGGVGCSNVGVHVYTCYAAGVSCAKVLRLGCFVVHCVNFCFLFKHGTLLVCSCVHMVRCWCVMCKRITQSQCHVWLSIVSSSWWVECISSCHVSQKQVKLHQTAFMANRVKWIPFKLQVIVDFSARFGEKNSRLDIVKPFIWKHDMQSTSETRWKPRTRMFTRLGKMDQLQWNHCAFVSSFSAVFFRCLR